jgi:NAD(P)-dependent dehydrogenase (short-subunit alcohol dehydrogenase family)
VLDGRVAVVVGGGPFEDGVRAALTTAGARVDAVMGAHVDIVVDLGPGVVKAMPIEEMLDADVASIFERPVQSTLQFALQAGRAKGATRFVLLLPSMAAADAGGLAAFCAATEARRLLAIAAARQWSGEGVTVNCLAVPFPYDDAQVADVAPVVTFLAGDAGASVNGETIRVGGPAAGL